MGLVDVLLMIAILGTAGWLFYRSAVKKKSGCAGCSGCSCRNNDSKGKDRLVRLS